MKATAKAYAIQGLIKYHGLRNTRLRIPYHDSISVCMKALPTITTVETRPDLTRDLMRIDGTTVAGREAARIHTILNELRKRTGNSVPVKVESKNPKVKGKGLGFSASGFAALTVAAAKVFGLSVSEKELSEIARLGAGSASRAVTGGFSIWFANNHGRSYAEMLASPEKLKMKTIIVPIASTIKTDTAHRDVMTSPFYRARIGYVTTMLAKMKRAIRDGDIGRIGELAEIDTLNLHAITMTGKARMVLFSPLSIQVIEEVKQMRSQGLPCWYSLDTGPSVFVNTVDRYAWKVRDLIARFAPATIVSDPGGPATLTRQHLF